MNSNSLPQSNTNIKIYNAETSNIKVADLKAGDEVIFDGKVYRVWCDGAKGNLRLWFIRECQS